MLDFPFCFWWFKFIGKCLTQLGFIGIHIKTRIVEWLAQIVWSMNFLGLLLLQECPSKPKVTQLDLTLIIQEYIRRLDISMYDVGRVQITDCWKCIVHYCSNMSVAELYVLWCFKYLLEIRLHEVHHDKYVFLLEIWRKNDIKNMRGKYVSFHFGQLVYDLNFTQCSLGDFVVVENFFD